MTQPEMKRVVVSGMGAVSPMGPDVAALWEGLAAGRRAIGRITKFDPTGLRNETGGQVWDCLLYTSSIEGIRPDSKTGN